MKKLIMLSMFSISFLAYGMEEKTTIEIALKDKVASISKEQFEAFKDVVDPAIKSMLEEGAPYALPSATKEGFDFIIKHVELINNKDEEALRGELEQLYEANDLAVFIGTLDIAAYLVIDHVLKVAYEFINEHVFLMITDNSKFLEAILKLSQDRHKQVRFFNSEMKTNDYHKVTVLMKAVIYGCHEICQMLISAGADIDYEGNTSGRTALAYASMHGNIECDKMLIKAGADINKRSNYTPLIWAAMNGKKEMIKILINAGADINKKDIRGNTALMWAVKNGKKECVKILIDAGADLAIQDKEGRTALMISVDKGHNDITELIAKQDA